MMNEQSPHAPPPIDPSNGGLYLPDPDPAMRRNGYFGIGCLNMKRSMNYGALFRTAQVFGADFIYLIGTRFRRQASDTEGSWRHIPTFTYKDFEDFNAHRPYACRLVGIELIGTATPLAAYKHPDQACYLLGSEDAGLSREALRHCQDVVRLPGQHSLNVAIAGSIVLYDRLCKA